MWKHTLLIILLSLLHCGCGGRDATQAVAPQAVAQDTMPIFDADSAYAYVARQVAFGPRVPGTPAHDATASWMVETLRSLGADTVIEQKTTVTAFNGNRLPINNIMARYNIDAPKRLLLLAHWDSRPWADADPDAANHTKPIPGANDGASGVGVLMELARMLGNKAPNIGVDLLMVDAEDYGDSGSEDSWCLGTQYWVDHLPYPPGQTPMYAVLLDMVGGQGARFHREAVSDYGASWVVDRVWAAASQAGYGSIFLNEKGQPVIDDHVPLLRAGIPAIDIIEAQSVATGTFPPYWHTMADDMPIIDRNTLKAVGQTMANIIYSER